MLKAAVCEGGWFDGRLPIVMMFHSWELSDIAAIFAPEIPNPLYPSFPLVGDGRFRLDCRRGAETCCFNMTPSNHQYQSRATNKANR